MFGFGSKQASVDVTALLVLLGWAEQLCLWLCRLHITAPPARFRLTDVELMFSTPCIWRAGLVGTIRMRVTQRRRGVGSQRAAACGNRPAAHAASSGTHVQVTELRREVSKALSLAL